MEAAEQKNIGADVISDFMSDEERTYYTKKLQEAEEHNLIHPQTWTSEEFYKRKREKYGI